MTSIFGDTSVAIGMGGFHPSRHARPLLGKRNYKQLLHEQLLGELGVSHSRLYRVDGFPMPLCGFKRAPQAQVFKEHASFGSSKTKLGTFYGFRGHLLIDASGIVLGLSITAANVDERAVVPELTMGLEGRLLRDKGYISHALQTNHSG